MITSKIADIEQKIKNLDEISGFKKSVMEYNKICKELVVCKSMLNQIEEKINTGSNMNNNIEITNDIATEEDFTKEMEELDLLCNNFDDLDLDDQVDVYSILLNKIAKCDKYLENLKMEIIAV